PPNLPIDYVLVPSYFKPQGAGPKVWPAVATAPFRFVVVQPEFCRRSELLAKNVRQLFGHSKIVILRPYRDHHVEFSNAIHAKWLAWGNWGPWVLVPPRHKRPHTGDFISFVANGSVGGHSGENRVLAKFYPTRASALINWCFSELGSAKQRAAKFRRMVR